MPSNSSSRSTTPSPTSSMNSLPSTPRGESFVSTHKTLTRAIKYYDQYTKESLKQAKELLDGILSIEPSNSIARFYKAKIYDLHEEFDLAIKECKEGLKYSNATYLYALKASMHSCKGETDKKTQTLSKAISISDNSLETALDFLGKGYAYKILKNDKEAVNYYNRALEIEPTNYFVETALARVYNDMGNQESSLEFSLRAHKHNSKFFEPVIKAADVLQDKGEYEQAIEYFNLALELNPQNFQNANATAYNRIALIYKSEEKYEEAITYFNKQLELQPNAVLNICSKAECLKELGRNQEAMKCLAQAYKLYKSGTVRTLTDEKKQFIEEMLSTLQVEDIVEEIAKSGELLSPTSRNDLMSMKAAAESGKVVDPDYYSEFKAKLEEKGSHTKMIKSNAKLHNYFKAFDYTLDKIMGGGLARVSEAVEKNKSAVSSVADFVADKLPYPASSILKLTGMAAGKIIEVRTDNQYKNFLLNFTTVESNRFELSHDIARKVTVSKRSIIEEANNTGQNKILKFLEKVKDKAFVNEYPTPEAKLAYKDAMVLVHYCMREDLSKTEAQQLDDLVTFISKYDSEEKEFLKAINDNDIKDILKAGQKCVIMAVPEIMYGGELPYVIEKAYEASKAYGEEGEELFKAFIGHISFDYSDYI